MTKKDGDRFVAFFAPKAVIPARQHELASLRHQLHDAIWDYRTYIHEVAAKLKAVHDRQLKSMYILGYIVKFGVTLNELPALEYFNGHAATLAADVIELVSPIISIIVMLIPGGEIIGMVLPFFFEGIAGIIDVGKLDDEIDVAKSNLQKLELVIRSNKATLSRTLESITATNQDMDLFEREVFRILGVQSWDEVLDMDIASVRFQRDIDEIGNIETEQQEQELENNLRDGNERTHFRNVFESKRKLTAQLKAMDGVQVQSTMAPRALSISRRSITIADPVVIAPPPAPAAAPPAPAADPPAPAAAPPAPAAASTATKGQTLGYASYESIEGKHRTEILKVKSYALAHQVVVLLRRMINIIFASHRGSSLGEDSSELNSLYKGVRDKVRRLVNEASRTFASVIKSLEIFESGRNWMEHFDSSTTALTGGTTISLGIIVPAILHGVLPHGGDVPKNGDGFQAYVQWKEMELQEVKNGIALATETLGSLSSDLLNSLAEHCPTWKGVGKTSADAEAVASELQKVDSFSSFMALKGLILQRIGDLEVQEEVLELVRMRMYLERALSQIEPTKSQ